MISVLLPSDRARPAGAVRVGHSGRCRGFHPEGLGGTAVEHRTAKERHVHAGTVHQVLV